MINHQHLYQLFLQNTGRSTYQVKALPGTEEGPSRAWQGARVQEYAFMAGGN